MSEPSCKRFGRSVKYGISIPALPLLVGPAGGGFRLALWLDVRLHVINVEGSNGLLGDRDPPPLAYFIMYLGKNAPPP